MTEPDRLAAIAQFRADRRHALNAWLAGGASFRWPGDDGRHLYLDERFAWPVNTVDAEQAEFDRLDGIYDAALAALRSP